MRSTLITLAFSCIAAALSAQDGDAVKITKFQFTGRTLGGQSVGQDAFKENSVIVDLWGTWCPPCRKAVPILVDLYGKYKHHGLEIVGFCYDANGSAEDSDKVRTFAVANRITYPLIPGDAAVRDQVPGFDGYPTLLLFRRGFTHDFTHVGYEENMAEKLETWVRDALGLDGTGDGKAGAAVKEKISVKKDQVPAGKLFEPGNGDHGFELQFEDIEGHRFSFVEMRGGPVLIALTTSWDQESIRTARFLETLRTKLPALRVIGWHLERDRDPTKKLDAVRSFVAAQKVGYPAFATELAAAREKIHRFASLPTMLLFDNDGVLVLREGGISDAIEQRIRDQAQKLTEKPDGRK